MGIFKEDIDWVIALPHLIFVVGYVCMFFVLLIMGFPISYSLVYTIVGLVMRQLFKKLYKIRENDKRRKEKKILKNEN